MAENIIELILKLKDQASSGVTSFAGKFRAGIAECQAATTALDSSINGVVKSLAGIATAGAISLGLTDVVKGGLASLDNTKMTAIGIASMLTGFADKTSGDLMAIYKNNLAYAQDMMAQIKAEAAKPSHFALPGEMIEAFRMVSQKGVVLTSDQDVETLAQMTDYIKILHGGQADAVTIATELRSVMEGQVMRGAQLARLMEQQLGPDWAELVEKARRAGTLMELLRKVSVGVALAAGDIGTAMITQASSLQATIGSIKSGGMKEAYDDVVSAMVQIDALLKAHKAEIIGGIRAGWRGFRDLVKEAWSYIQMIAQFSAENPTLTAMTKDALLLAAGISAAASMIRVFGGVASWIFGAVASLMSPIVTIISKLGSGLGSLLSAALKLNPAFGAIVIVLLAIGVAIAGWKLADVIGEWQIAGLKIKEYVELAKLYLDNFCIYLSTDFAQEVNTAFSNMGDSIVNAFANALAKAQVQLTTWAQSVWKWIKEWNDDPNPFGISWAGPSTRGSTTSAGVEAIPPEGDEAMLKAREAANKARIKEIQEAGAQRRATGVESDDKGATDKPSHTKPKINIKESQDGGKGGSGGAKQTAEAELALAKAVAAHKVALVEQEQAAVELAYQQGQMSAEEYYAQLQRLNGAELNARLEGLQEEKNAIQKGLSEEMSAAKSGEQASAVRTRADAKLLAIEDQIAKAKSESAKKTVELAEQERRAIQDRASATANALTTMLDEEQISADQRQSIASRLLAAQIKEIRAEALEVEKKTAGAVKAEEYAAAKIK
ncbi:MAG: hypothetical protein LLG06_12210, partial [Desulfobacteraceae bacterium]|nr:hypothetical protein [Desulfobacteraceae bacterium]